MSSKIKTTVKFLNGDIITVEHHKGSGEQGLKDAINSLRPEMYSECQQIIIDEDKDNYVYVLMDTVDNCINVEVNIVNDNLINMNNDRIDKYDIDEFVQYIEDYFEYSKYFDDFEDYKNNENIKTKHISIYWSSLYTKGKMGYTLYWIYHPILGLTTSDFMHDNFVETYRDNTLYISMVPKYKEKERVWFSTFRDIINNINTSSRLPAIFSSESFIDKVQKVIDDL
jgi:hypothetical protein